MGRAVRRRSYVRDRINAFAPSAERPFVLGLPTGSTPIPTYEKLVEYVAAGTLSFKHVVTFNMDECARKIPLYSRLLHFAI